MLDFFEKIFSDPLGAITSVALGAFQGVGGTGKGTGSGSAAAAAQSTELGFAKARAQAEKFAAERRSGQRMSAKEESQKQPTKYEQEVLNMYNKAFQGSSIRDQVVKQLINQGYGTHNIVLGALDSTADTDPRLNVKGVG
tara:strand:- start:1575 stop:1994 length:420 start_codon:yes stop_codon:yes gene_type:complete